VGSICGSMEESVTGKWWSSIERVFAEEVKRLKRKPECKNDQLEQG